MLIVGGGVWMADAAEAARALAARKAKVRGSSGMASMVISAPVIRASKSM